MSGKGIMTALLLALVMTTAPAWAKDKVQAEVTATSPTAVVTPNGSAVGTIHVIYTVNAFEFTPGSFGSFDVDFSILPVIGNPETSYPLTLKLTQKQEGAGNPVLAPATEAFSVPDKAWGGGTTVTVSLPENLPSLDGTTVTGTMQIEADGPLDSKEKATNAQLDTNTTIVVKVVLLHPTACLKLANFVTDNEFNAIDSAVVNLKSKNGVTTVNATNPGQFSDNILIVNNCGGDQEVDLRIGLNSCFDTNPSGNPGQAVFTWLTAGEVDEENFDISSFVAKTGQGQSLCLSGLTVPDGQTLLATVHMGAVKGTLSTDLPADKSFDFTAAVFEAGSGCTDGIQHSMADPNPATASVPFTTK